MKTLFEPKLIARDAGHARFALELEPQQPYLDHHRPGGEPLFATVLGIEAMAAAAQQYCAAEVLQAQNVCVGPPCILSTAQPRIVHIDVMQGAQPDAVECQLSSENAGESVRHFSARMIKASTGMPPLVARPLAIKSTSSVAAAQVYSLFFHGPAFRVVHAAEWRGHELHASMANELPSLRAGVSCATRLLPRLIEFALQSAGLFELARSGQMRIPHAIGSIWRTPVFDELASPRVHACVIAGSHDGIDMDVCTDQGEGVLAVRDYQTVTMPFPDDSASLVRLRDALRATARK